jgi:hypothetical protein
VTEIVNLRQARKRQRRGEKERTAAENRVLHGRPAAERAAAELERDRTAKRLENHRRTPPEGE